MLKQYNMNRQLSALERDADSGKSLQDATSTILLNSRSAPEWAAAPDMGQRITPVTSLPRCTYSPCRSATYGVTDARQPYQQPVQLVVLESQLQRLGPSTPYRYTAVPAPGLAAWHLQRPLLSPVALSGTTTRWAADASTQTLPDWLAVAAQRVGVCPGTSRQLSPCSVRGKSEGHSHGTDCLAIPISPGKHHSARMISTSPWRRCPSPRLVPHQACRSLSSQAGCILAKKPGLLRTVAGSPTGHRCRCNCLTDGGGFGLRNADASQCANSSKRLAAHTCIDWRACNPVSRHKAAQIAHSKARRQVEVSARYAAIGRAAARENAARVAAALESQLEQQEQTDAPCNIYCHAMDPETILTNQNPVNSRAVSDVQFNAVKYHTASPAEQHWQPAQVCADDVRIQREQPAAGLHAAHSASFQPPTHTTMADQQQPWTIGGSAEQNPSTLTLAGRASSCTSSKSQGQQKAPRCCQQTSWQLDLSVAEVWGQLAHAAAAFNEHKQVCAADVADRDISAIKLMLGQWRVDEELASMNGCGLPLKQCNRSATAVATHQPDTGIIGLKTAEALLQQADLALLEANVCDSATAQNSQKIGSKERRCCSRHPPLSLQTQGSSVDAVAQSSHALQQPSSFGIQYARVKLKPSARTVDVTNAATAANFQSACVAPGTSYRNSTSSSFSSRVTHLAEAEVYDEGARSALPAAFSSCDMMSDQITAIEADRSKSVHSAALDESTVHALV